MDTETETKPLPVNEHMVSEATHSWSMNNGTLGGGDLYSVLCQF
jgi:hypothetical protein